MDLIVEPEVSLAPALHAWIEAVACAVLDEVAHDLALEVPAEACLVLTDDPGIHALNATWRGIDRPTDVLSFAQQDGEFAGLTPHLLGDVVVSVDTAARVAAAGAHRDRVASDAGWDGPWHLGHELAFLVVHGALHLVGHDHAEPDEEAVMRAEEKRILHAVLARCGAPPAGGGA